jgi:hypothetical protein
MIDRARERNRALRIARSRARSGDEATASAWLAVAESFAAPTTQQLADLARALEQGRGGSFLQPTLDGRVVEFHANGRRAEVA